VAACRAGQLDLAHLRGRSCYSQPVQAAEYYLRSATGDTALHGYRLISEIEEQPARWVVRFEALADGRVHEVRLAADRARVEVYLSSADSSPELLPQYELVGYAVLD
jgi:hypothetical protein